MPTVLDQYHEEFEETPTWAAVITVLGYAVLSALGWLRDFLRYTGLEKKKTSQDPNPKVSTKDVCILTRQRKQTDIFPCKTGLRSTLSKLRMLLHAKSVHSNTWRVQSAHRQCSWS